jgi:hypothetical protein
VGFIARGQAALVRRKLAAEGVEITYTRKPTSYTLRGWLGRGMQFTEALTGQRVEISEREFFLARADMAAAGLEEPRRGDRLQVTGEPWLFEVLDPGTLGEAAWRTANSERTYFRIHTKLVESS